MLIDSLKNAKFPGAQPRQGGPCIQELSQKQGVSFQRVQGDLLDKRLKEWQAELKGHLKPIK
jgi:hypothetical protein